MPLPRYTGETAGISVRPGAAILHRANEEDPWVLKVWGDVAWKRIPLPSSCVCHPTTGPCDSAIEDTAKRILRGDDPNIYKP